MWAMLDLDVYRAGGRAVLDGSGLYDLRFTSVKLPFTYPPLAAAVFAPLSLLPVTVARTLMVVGTLGALAWVIWRVFGILGHRGARRTNLSLLVGGACLWLEPVQQTLGFGQVNVLLMALVLGDLLRDDRSRTKGIGVGLAAGLKLTPGIFAVYLFVTGRTRAAITAVVTFVATIGFSFLLTPSEAARFWGDRLFMDSERVGGVPFVGNQSLHGFISRLAHASTAGDRWWFVVAIVVGATGMYAARQAYVRAGEVPGVLLCALTALLISPISWSHHWVYVAPALAYGVHLAIEHRSRWMWAAIGAGWALFAAWPFSRGPHDPWMPRGVIWLVPLSTENREFNWHGSQLIVGNAEVLAGLLVLAVVCFTTMRRDNS
jgi:alpha-1,2-mannosyltransferase